MSDLFKGYKGRALHVLKNFNVRVWSEAKIKTTRGDFQGIVLPRSETDDDRHIVLKLSTGYNIGIAVDTIQDMQEYGYKEAHYKIPEREFPTSPDKRNVKMLGTGGTIASRLDYRTGAVIPAFSPGELYGAVPELADICNLSTEKLFAVFSENMGPTQYKVLAQAIGEEIKKGTDGIIIGHGTDTMHHTASAISFMVQNPPIPIVMVGSQRSSDRPSSDAALNLIHATTTAAESDIAEVMVCMFGPTSDEYGLLHRGTRVRKMHSSYRSTFRTIGDIPLAMVNREKITPLRQDYNRRRNDRNVTIVPVFEERVSLLYYYPNMHPDIIEAMIDLDYKGIVIAGTGLGHVNKPLYPAIKRAVEKGIVVYMTVQTLWGYVHMFVYDTGRDLMSLGIIPTENMLPEVAYIKLGWALGQTSNLDEVKEIMLTPICDEITEREPYNGYLIYQGGIPEVEEFIKQFHK
ncbi:MAG: Glu-tRNA(Gln) amidotransferase subunit GatD [bacterium]|nr:Glu-tRNA(Gln) amidotransferase subunit GatD [bacterium]